LSRTTPIGKRETRTPAVGSRSSLTPKLLVHHPCKGAGHIGASIGFHREASTDLGQDRHSHPEQQVDIGISLPVLGIGVKKPLACRFEPLEVRVEHCLELPQRHPLLVIDLLTDDEERINEVGQADERAFHPVVARTA